MGSRAKKAFPTTFGSDPDEKESGQDSTSKNEVNTKGSEASRLNQETKVEQMDETDDASSDYKTLLQEIRLAARKGFQDLKEKCASLKLPALQMAEEEEFLWDELQPDGTSQKLLPPDKASRYSALKTTADGNCFFRTASILAFGNEHKHGEMRVRIVIELACNSDFYLKDKDIEKMLIAEAQELEADEAPDLHSGRGRPTSPLSAEALRGIFEIEVRHTTHDKIWACHWHLQALAAVLNRQVLSVYPECGGKEIKKYLNTVIVPRCCDEKIKMKEPVALMWTQANRSGPFKPDHFVPLIPVDKIPCNSTNNPPPWKRNDTPLPSEEEYRSLSNQNGPPSVPSRGPICEEIGKAGKVSVHAGSLVKQIISEDPFVLDEVCLKLDYPVKKSRCGYWPHFAHLLDASEETKKRCQNRSNYKPSLMMFTYLSTTLPGFTVNDLEFYLGKIEKGNLVSMLKQSCVKGTERLTVLSQRDWKTFHAICLDLDCSNMYNWQDLGTQIGISLEIFEKCKRPEEYADLALQIISTRQPYLSVGKMKDVLTEMDRRDVVEKLNELPDESDIKTLLESYDVLQKVTRLLEKETPQNWQVFAQKFGVSKEECDYLCPEDYHSPTAALMEYLSAAYENLTLQTFIESLMKIRREDVVKSLKEFFHPIDIDHIVNNIRLRGLGSNANELGTAEQTNPWKLMQVSAESDIK